MSKEFKVEIKDVKVPVYNIEWDTDDKTGLPSEVEIVVPKEEFIDEEINNFDDYDTVIGNYLENALSDIYGFCHYGFKYDLPEI